MAMVCTQITEWIEEGFPKKVEKWEEEQYEKCKKRSRWNPLRWLCWIATRLVKVIRWVIVTVLTAVITIVCHAVAGVLGILLGLLKGVVLLLAGLLTWNKCLIQEGLGGLFDAVAGALTLIGDVVIRPITQRVQARRLRKYVGKRIDDLYGDTPTVANTLKERFSVRYGSFGYRLTCTVYRMFVDSLTDSEMEPGVPNLYKLHADTPVDLYRLAGFDPGCEFTSKKGWYRPRPLALKAPFTAANAAARLKRKELDEYIESQGTRGPHFRIYPITPGNLRTRRRTASEKSRQLGLKLDFTVEDREVTDHDYIELKKSFVNLSPTDCSTRIRGQLDFLICELGRKPKQAHECCNTRQPQQPVAVQGTTDEARRELCAPVAVAVFGFTDRTARGFANNLIGTTHCDRTVQLTASKASGVTFIDDIPDELRKYVLIHELGHYFGLCHVDGFDRIMVSGEEEQASLWTWWAVPNSFVHGGPRFTLAEGKIVWDFILDNFPLSCFGIEEEIVVL
jgi:hypothetical protein